ncbi:MAG TPA: cytochrome c oxidase subunit II [Gaiellaceae bacterium]|nr:cytochrome c oxidase subunit II [Gaiellaceae bacterium]
MRWSQIVQLAVVAAIVAAATTAVAVLVPWLPVNAAEQRDGIDFTFWLATGICIFIFAVVVSAILFSVWKFRARADDDTDGPPIHGHTGLEIAWTAVPALLVTTIAVAASVVLTQNSDAGSNPLRVNVTAQQFAWEFEYVNGSGRGKKSPTLQLPLGRTVELSLRSKDVIHSLWVPEFGQKIDALPYVEEFPHPTKLVITPTKLGTFPVICTELCGLGHSLMRSTVVVVRPAEFQRWLRSLQ